MISYHLNQSFDSKHYGYGFKTADVVDMKRIAKCMTKYVWSPCIWKDGRRSQQNFIAARFCVLDFDDGEMTLAEAKNIFCDCVHIIGTTKSHQKVKNNIVCDRFRVLFVFAHPIEDLRLYRWNMHKYMRNYPCDKSCKDGARFFYPCQEIVSISSEGYKQDIFLNVPDTFEKPKIIPSCMISSKTIPNRIINEFNRKYTMNNRHSAIYRFACLLSPYDFTPSEILMRIKQSEVFKLYPEKVDSDEEILRTITNALDATRMGDLK